ncbi:EF-hand domain-containing protein [Spongisporangium articulatum]|uniref:EF-hand domain-containing protein n=1 Tax=Spongisporangium articulatum TaxID=3362603 RepID=A0ABW8AQR0_9ACTN
MADLSEYAATFDLIDTDHDGRISHEEFTNLLEALGGARTPEGVEHAFEVLDADGDGQITLEEFGAYLASTEA